MSNDASMHILNDSVGAEDVDAAELDPIDAADHDEDGADDAERLGDQLFAAGIPLPLTSLTPEDPEWHGKALCAQTDPEAFFPEKGGSTRDAKKICTGCEVRSECLSYALEHDERFGIWGGLSERERRRLKRMAS